jgi:hypothetical protein
MKTTSNVPRREDSSFVLPQARSVIPSARALQARGPVSCHGIFYNQHPVRAVRGRAKLLTPAADRSFNPRTNPRPRIKPPQKPGLAEVTPHPPTKTER